VTNEETRVEGNNHDEEASSMGSAEPEKIRPKGGDPNETVLEDRLTKRSEGFGLAGRSFVGKVATYSVREEIEASGSEADVYVVQEQDSGHKRALKYYRMGISPKEEITGILADLDKKHVVQVYETGYKDGRSYEIQEFIEHGSLADMVVSSGLPDDRMKEIMQELLVAVEHLHERKVIHRDLKPANIMIRTSEPLDLVFTDFGIASQTELSLHRTSDSRTVSYASPEALVGVVGKASDWWSVGVILLELLTGRHPFAGMHEQAINFQLVSKGVVVPNEIEEDWKLLLKGLLTIDRENRWGVEQVRRWLEGDRSMSVGYGSTPNQGESAKRHDYRPYQFGGKEYYEPKELAVALGEDWPNGVKNFGRGFLTDWIENEFCSTELTAELKRVMEDEVLDASQRLSVAIMVMNPELPLLDGKGVFNRDSVRSRADECHKILSSGLGRWLKALKGEDWLLELERKHDKFREQIDLHGEHVDETLASQFFVFDEEELEDKWEEFRREYGACSVSQLNQAFESENPDDAHKIAILSLPRELLKTHEEVRKDNLRLVLKDQLEYIDEQKAFDLDLLDDDELDRKWVKLRDKNSGFQVPSLNHSFNLKNPKRIDKIAILSIWLNLLPVRFKCSKLGLVLHEALEHPTVLSQKSLATLSSLYQYGGGIADVTGLEHATKLRRLSLGGNHITDISPLKHLTKLTFLDLNSNSITDVAPLAELAELNHLNLYNNPFTDFAPLMKLTNLGRLYLGGFPITEYQNSMLRNALPQCAIYFSPTNEKVVGD
jgi:serine/threonine protein kinase